MSYADRLSQIKRDSFPRNPCKFLKVWKADGKDKYDEIMEAIFLEDYELNDIASVLNDDLDCTVTKADVWKHRKLQCHGCHFMAERSA